MALTRKKLIAGVMLAGLAGGVTVTGVARHAFAGPGDPPVIVLPSARAAAKQGPIIQAQNTQPAPAPKLEILPLPSPAPAATASNSKPPVAPPSITAPVQPLQLPAPANTLPSKEPPAAIANDIVPKPLEVLPPPAAKAAEPNGESAIMTIKPAIAATVASIFMGGNVRAEEPKPQTVPSDVAKADDVKALKAEIESLRKLIVAPPLDYSKAADVKALKEEVESLRKLIVAPPLDYSKATDVKALKDEIDSLKKEISGLSAKGSDASKAGDVKAIKDEIDLLRKDLGAKAADALKAADLKTLKDEVAALRKDLENAPKPVDSSKLVKEDVESLRKEVAALQTYLKESLEGKRDVRGFTHEGLIARMKKLDESIAAMEKKVDAGTKSVSAKPEKTVEPTAPATAGPVGVVRIVNEYPVEISIVVNGIAYRLDPNATKDVTVTAGTFKYQLLTSGGNETERSIKTSETVTLTIR